MLTSIFSNAEYYISLNLYNFVSKQGNKEREEKRKKGKREKQDNRKRKIEKREERIYYNGTMPFSITTLSITGLSIKTLSIKGLFATLSIMTFSNDTA
jgi:hypothetical protein